MMSCPNCGGKLVFENNDYIDKQKVKDAIPEVIKLFASLDAPDGMGVWGYDTELFLTKAEAVEAVMKVLGLDDD